MAPGMGAPLYFSLPYAGVVKKRKDKISEGTSWPSLPLLPPHRHITGPFPFVTLEKCCVFVELSREFMLHWSAQRLSPPPFSTFVAELEP